MNSFLTKQYSTSPGNFSVTSDDERDLYRNETKKKSVGSFYLNNVGEGYELQSNDHLVSIKSRPQKRSLVPKYCRMRALMTCVPFYSRFCNSFVSRQMISVSIQICFLNAILLIVALWGADKLIPNHSSQSGYGLLLRNTKTSLYYALANICLGLPVTGLPMFQIYKKVEIGRTLDQVKRTPYLTFCELLAMVEISFLLYKLYMMVYHLFITLNYRVLYGQLDDVTFIVVAIVFFISIYAYFLNWYQLVLFNRYRDHALFQRGLYPTCRLFRKIHPDMGWGAKQKRIQTIKHQLYVAVDKGDIENVKQSLIEAKSIDPDFATKWYACSPQLFGLIVYSARNPLHVACANHHLYVAKLLLGAGFDVNALDKIQRARLGLSSWYNRIYNLIFFLKSSNFGYNLSAKYGSTGLFVQTQLSPLAVATLCADAEMMQLLIEGGADVNLSSTSTFRKERVPPLFHAQNEESVHVLLRSGANHLCVPGNGYYLTAFQEAILKNRSHVAAAIEFWGGDIALTPLHRAAAVGDSSTLVSFLSYGATPDALGENAQGIFKRTPMHWAAMRGQTEAIHTLLDYGAEVDPKDSHGMTPLGWAVFHNRLESVRALLQAGADASGLDRNGRNWFAIAAEVDCTRELVFRELRQAGADINLPLLHSGDTPLHVAIRRGHRKTAVSLLKVGADSSLLNAMGQRAIDCTTSSDLQFIIKKEAGARDVMISYTHTHAPFAQKIAESLEEHHLTTWIDHMSHSGIGGGSIWREEIARGIQNCSVVVAILSKDYADSQWCMKELAFAKQKNIPVLAIMCEEVNLTDELQVYLFTRQMVEFQTAILASHWTHQTCLYEYDEAAYTSRVCALLDGLRDIIESRRVINRNSLMPEVVTTGSRERSSTLYRLSGTNALDSEYSVFISHGGHHPSFVRRLKTSLRTLGISCYVDGDDLRGDLNDRNRASKDAILNCSAFLVILSNSSSNNSTVSDQLAFAEDKGKKIFPILLSSYTLNLDKQYSLSREKFYHFAESFGYEDSFDTLKDSLVAFTEVGIDVESDRSSQSSRISLTGLKTDSTDNATLDITAASSPIKSRVSFDADNITQ